MPRKDEPRVMVRFDVAGHAAVAAIAQSLGIGTAALVREAAVRYGPQVARDIREGRVVLRSANGSRRGGVARPAPTAREEMDEAAVRRAQAFRRATS